MKQFPYRNTASCEIEQLARLRDAGYEALLQPLDFAGRLSEQWQTLFPRDDFQALAAMLSEATLFGRVDWFEHYLRTLLETLCQARRDFAPPCAF